MVFELGSCLPANNSIDATTVDYISTLVRDAISENAESGEEDIREIIEPFLADSGYSEESIEAVLAKAFSQLQLKTIVPKEEKLLHAPIQMSATLATETKDIKEEEAPPAASAQPKKVAIPAAAPKVEENDDVRVFAQVSRFHREAVNYENREVNLNDVCIQCVGKDLLSGARIQLLPGRKYGLIGRNGVGKTTLLSYMASGRLVGFPLHVSCLLVAQEAEDSTLPPVEYVISGDDKLLEARRLYNVLKEAIDGGSGTTAAAAYVNAERAKAFAKEKRDIANMRSRQRGKEARELALAAEAASRAAEAEAAEALAEHMARQHSSEEGFATASELLLEYEEMLKDLENDTAEGRATAILKGLQFSDQMLANPSNSLSGGWRMRLALAQSIFLRPDILLLDEPTNHLDLHAILWLEHHLNTQMDDTAVVIVSHDRQFLDAVVTQIIHFKNASLVYHDGNFSDFEHKTEDLAAKHNRLYELQEKKKEMMKAQVQKMTQAAAKSHDDKKMVQAKSRKKKLEERSGLDFLEDGTRFKLSYHGYGLKTTKRYEITPDAPEPPVHIEFLEPENLGTYGSIMSLEGVTFGYERGRPVVSNVTLNIEANSRISLLGKNGAGKSTIMKMLSGEEEPWSGEIKRHKNLVVASFTQHCIDVLDRDSTPILTFMKAFPGLKEQQTRSPLASFGLSGKLAEQLVHTLSGGQKARLALALMAYTKPHVLLLDEPSNHLDHLTIDGLVEGLVEYQGAVVLVSHDQRLVSSLGGSLYVVQKGTCRLYEGTFGDYVAGLRSKLKF